MFRFENPNQVNVVLGETIVCLISRLLLNGIKLNMFLIITNEEAYIYIITTDTYHLFSAICSVNVDYVLCSARCVSRKYVARRLNVILAQFDHANGMNPKPAIGD